MEKRSTARPTRVSNRKPFHIPVCVSPLPSGCSAAEDPAAGVPTMRGGVAPEGAAPGFVCADSTCELAEAPAPPGCGDGLRTNDEACDGGNRTPADGCSANCLVAE